MSKRKLIIDTCDQCPFFDNFYWEYNHKCTKLDEFLQQEDDYSTKIPDECPLEKDEVSNE